MTAPLRLSVLQRFSAVPAVVVRGSRKASCLREATSERDPRTLPFGAGENTRSDGNERLVVYSLLTMSVCAVVFALVLTPMFRSLFQRLDIVDRPDQFRKFH